MGLFLDSRNSARKISTSPKFSFPYITVSYLSDVYRKHVGWGWVWKHISAMWKLMPAIPEFRRLRQEDHYEFKASLWLWGEFIAWAIERETLPGNKVKWTQLWGPNSVFLKVLWVRSKTFDFWVSSHILWTTCSITADRQTDSLPEKELSATTESMALLEFERALLLRLGNGAVLNSFQAETRTASLGKYLSCCPMTKK